MWRNSISFDQSDVVAGNGGGKEELPGRPSAVKRVKAALSSASRLEGLRARARIRLGRTGLGGEIRCSQLRQALEILVPRLSRQQLHSFLRIAARDGGAHGSPGVAAAPVTAVPAPRAVLNFYRLSRLVEAPQGSRRGTVQPSPPKAGELALRRIMERWMRALAPSRATADERTAIEDIFKVVGGGRSVCVSALANAVASSLPRSSRWEGQERDEERIVKNFVRSLADGGE